MTEDNEILVHGQYQRKENDAAACSFANLFYQRGHGMTAEPREKSVRPLSISTCLTLVSPTDVRVVVQYSKGGVEVKTPDYKQIYSNVTRRNADNHPVRSV